MRSVAADGLTLEPQTAAHAEPMFAVLSDPAIYEYENGPPQSIEWLRDRFTKLESRLSPDGREQWLNWVIRVPTSDRGACSSGCDSRLWLRSGARNTTSNRTKT